MAPLSPVSRHPLRDNIFTEVGLVGRKTGLAVNDVERNEDGMEEMSAFFSPAPPSIPDEDYSDELDEPVHTIATSRQAGDASASMDLNQSTMLDPTMALTARKEQQGSLQRSSPARSGGLSSPPRRNPNIRRSSPFQRSPSRLLSSPTRRLDYRSPLLPVTGSPRRPPPLARSPVPSNHKPMVDSPVDLPDDDDDDVVDMVVTPPRAIPDDEQVTPTPRRTISTKVKESINRPAASMKLKQARGLLSQRNAPKVAVDEQIPSSDDNDSDIESVDAVVPAGSEDLEALPLAKTTGLADTATEKPTKNNSKPTTDHRAASKALDEKTADDFVDENMSEEEEESENEAFALKGHKLSRRTAIAPPPKPTTKAATKQAVTKTLPRQKEIEINDPDTSVSDSEQAIVPVKKTAKGKENITPAPVNKIVGKRGHELEDAGEEKATVLKKGRPPKVLVSPAINENSVKKGRGRPKKVDGGEAAVDRVDEDSVDTITVKKKAGRPKKTTPAPVAVEEAVEDEHEKLVKPTKMKSGRQAKNASVTEEVMENETETVLHPMVKGKPGRRAKKAASPLAVNSSAEASVDLPEFAIRKDPLASGQASNKSKRGNPIKVTKLEDEVEESIAEKRKRSRPRKSDDESVSVVEPPGKISKSKRPVVEDIAFIDPATLAQGRRKFTKSGAVAMGPVSKDETEDEAENQEMDEIPVQLKKEVHKKRKVAEAEMQEDQETIFSRKKGRGNSAQPVSKVNQTNKQNVTKEVYELPVAPGSGRPQRARIAPLAYWKNETIEYKTGGRRASGTVTTVRMEVIRVEDEENPTKKKAGRRAKPITSVSHVISKAEVPRLGDDSGLEDAQDTDLEDEEDWEKNGNFQLSAMVAMYPPPEAEEGEDEYEEEEVVAMSRHAMAPKGVLGSDYKFHKTFGNPFMGSGILEFKSGAEKKTKSSGRMHYFFYVVSGKVEVEVNEMSFRIGSHGQFQVPRGNNYRISNPFKKVAKVYFVQACEKSPEDDR